jgi:hypothetical protein
MSKTKSAKKISKKSSSKKTTKDRFYLSVLKKSLIVSGAILVLSTLVFPFAHLTDNSAGALTAKTAVVYGDSLTQESAWAINQQFATKKGWAYTVRSWGGTAPCDWATWLPSDLNLHQPSVVSISTAGNSLTPCMKDANGNNLAFGTSEYYDRYRTALDSMFSQITATGAKVVFMKAPPMKDATRDASVKQIAVIAQELAANYHGVSISSVPRNSVSTNGKYVETKPCLATETVAMGCQADGRIKIRSWDGVHLCPVTLGAYSACSIYSSGEFRWGKAIANTTVNPPAPILP